MDHDIFLKIINRDVPADIVYEHDHCIAFYDIAPKAPTHVLVVPKKKVSKLSEYNPQTDAEVTHAFTQIPKIAKLLNLDDYRVIINCGEKACQTVFHIHIHIMGGQSLNWPPG